MLDERILILTPMTNAVGYYYQEREERINTNDPDFLNNPIRKGIYSKTSEDVNRDFPYNTESD